MIVNFIILYYSIGYTKLSGIMIYSNKYTKIQCEVVFVCFCIYIESSFSSSKDILLLSIVKNKVSSFIKSSSIVNCSSFHLNELLHIEVYILLYIKNNFILGIDFF